MDYFYKWRVKINLEGEIIMSNQLNTGSSNKTTTQGSNSMGKVGFGFGVSSIFLGGIGIIPMIGFIISTIGLIKYNKSTDNGLWMGVSGLILNLIYLVANAYANGNIG